MCMCVCVCVYVYVCMCMCVCVCGYVYVCIFWLIYWFWSRMLCWLFCFYLYIFMLVSKIYSTSILEYLLISWFGHCMWGSIHYTLIHVWKNYIPFKLLSGKIIYISMPVSGKLVSFHRCCLEEKKHEVCTNPVLGVYKH